MSSETAGGRLRSPPAPPIVLQLLRVRFWIVTVTAACVAVPRRPGPDKETAQLVVTRERKPLGVTPLRSLEDSPTFEPAIDVASEYPTAQKALEWGSNAKRTIVAAQ